MIELSEIDKHIYFGELAREGKKMLTWTASPIHENEFTVYDRPDRILARYKGLDGLKLAIALYNGLTPLNNDEILEYKQYIKLKEKYSKYDVL